MQLASGQPSGQVVWHATRFTCGMHPTGTREKKSVLHSHNCFDYCTTGKSAAVAAQQGMGILPERGNQPCPAHPRNTVPDGSALIGVSAIEARGALPCRYRSFCGSNRRGDDLGRTRIIKEISAGMQFKHIHKARLGIFKTLDRFHPDWTTVWKVPEDVVDCIHGLPPRSALEIWSNRPELRSEEGQFNCQKWQTSTMPTPIKPPRYSDGVSGATTYHVVLCKMTKDHVNISRLRVSRKSGPLLAAESGAR